MTRSIPERWQMYKPYGTVIEGTNILPFKVPLKEAIAKNLPASQQFTPAQLIKKFPNLKYIVDLTHTKRYYYAEEFSKTGIYCHKIMIPGKAVPPIQLVKRFFETMDEFMSNAKSGELIGVHCTHGINRTGYLICRYLTQQLGWEPEKSVKAFEKARGYPIERTAYVNDLMKLPRTKLDTSGFNLKHSLKRNPSLIGPMGVPMFDHRHRFANGRPYPPPPPFGYGGPPPPRGFGPRPPPLPPPPQGRWLDGPRPLAYGMLPPRPPRPGPFPGPRFVPRIPGPPGMPGPPRLPPPNLGPPSRLPGPGMPPPRLPPPGMGSPWIPPPGMGPPRLPAPRMPLPHMPPPRLSNARRNHEHIPADIAFGPSKIAKTSATLQAGTVPTARITKDLDFTVDTFDENLTTAVCP